MSCCGFELSVIGSTAARLPDAECLLRQFGGRISPRDKRRRDVGADLDVQRRSVGVVQLPLKRGRQAGLDVLRRDRHAMQDRLRVRVRGERGQDRRRAVAGRERRVGAALADGVERDRRRLWSGVVLHWSGLGRLGAGLRAGAARLDLRRKDHFVDAQEIRLEVEPDDALVAVEDGHGRRRGDRLRSDRAIGRVARDVHRVGDLGALRLGEETRPLRRDVAVIREHGRRAAGASRNVHRGDALRLEVADAVDPSWVDAVRLSVVLDERRKPRHPVRVRGERSREPEPRPSVHVRDHRPPERREVEVREAGKRRVCVPSVKALLDRHPRPLRHGAPAEKRERVVRNRQDVLEEPTVATCPGVVALVEVEPDLRLAFEEDDDAPRADAMVVDPLDVPEPDGLGTCGLQRRAFRPVQRRVDADRPVVIDRDFGARQVGEDAGERLVGGVVKFEVLDGKRVDLREVDREVSRAHAKRLVLRDDERQHVFEDRPRRPRRTALRQRRRVIADAVHKLRDLADVLRVVEPLVSNLAPHVVAARSNVDVGPREAAVGDAEPG